MLLDAQLVQVRAQGRHRYYSLDPAGITAAQLWLSHLVDPFRQPLDALETAIARGRRMPPAPTRLHKQLARRLSTVAARNKAGPFASHRLRHDLNHACPGFGDKSGLRARSSPAHDPAPLNPMKRSRLTGARRAVARATSTATCSRHIGIEPHRMVESLGSLGPGRRERLARPLPSHCAVLNPRITDGVDAPIDDRGTALRPVPPLQIAAPRRPGGAALRPE